MFAIFGNRVKFVEFVFAQPSAPRRETRIPKPIKTRTVRTTTTTERLRVTAPSFAKSSGLRPAVITASVLPGKFSVSVMSICVRSRQLAGKASDKRRKRTPIQTAAQWAVRSLEFRFPVSSYFSRRHATTGSPETETLTRT